MAKKNIQKIAFALVLSLAVCSASPARLDKLSASRSKLLARQEVAEDIPAQTPYPPAGNKPDVAFDLPTDAKLKQPHNTYLPPAEIYGPPEVSLKDDAEELANDESEQPLEEVQPENPQPEKIESADGAEDEEADEAKQQEAESEQDTDNPLSERIVLASRNGGKSAKLQAAVAARPIVAQPIFVVGNNGQLYRLLY